MNTQTGQTRKPPLVRVMVMGSVWEVPAAQAIRLTASGIAGWLSNRERDEAHALASTPDLSVWRGQRNPDPDEPF